MKFAIALAVLCCLTIGAFALPTAKISEEKTLNRNVVGTQRQAAQPPAVSEDEDDDDDDDDVDFDITGDDDDDDDDEEEDDDDDDDSDYLERFIEDILGEEDDDDDDDEETSAVEPVAPASQPAVQAIPAAVEADLNAAAQETEQAAEVAAEATGADNESTGAEDEEGNTIAEGQAASNVHESTLEVAESVSNPVHVPAVSTNVADTDDEDDDDDDDDDDEDVDLVYTEEEEEDEDEDEDDEDDDDVDSITDITGARQARGMRSDSSSDVSAIYVAKYNRFVDNILERINKILRNNYDPVTVKLTNPNTRSKTNKQKSKGKLKKNSNKSGTKKSGIDRVTITTEKIAMDLLENTQKTLENTENITASLNAIEKEALATTSSDIGNRSIMESATKSTNRRTSGTGSKKTNKNRGTTKNKTKNQVTNNKNKAKKAKPKARATLYGLASLQRSGDVSVNMMSDHTMIKTRFTLGPLILKVEKEFGRTAKKELRSATATTAEMSGKLSLRVLHGGVATLNSIRVLQPKQVRVESTDDHDRTREFVWKRSSHIAHLVSEKLSLATKSMLRPPPVTITSA
ncbi:uncharacterized protein LOC117604895 [Osmia lignaria lignaria]|uniref:uncharacterized protein LOC117604895 n=1 Tax=Osmia lignaria lignaria TaxID=1437193 RepID=UPI00402B98EB